MSATTTGIDTRLYVPVVSTENGVLSAALAYAAAGLYVGPVAAGTKNPGSVLGASWPQKTSRDPQVIVAGFSGTNHGVFVHAGRSGLVIFDVDDPDKVHHDIRRAVDELDPPFQSTRPDEPGRGHYLFAVPPGRRLGNALGKLADGWGDVRGQNGVIVVAPTVHPSGGLYAWLRTGPVPVLPDYVADQLPEAVDAAEAATDGEVASFFASHQDVVPVDGLPPASTLLDLQVQGIERKFVAGESRHSTMCGPLAQLMREAAAGLVDAKLAADTLASVFLAAVAEPASSARQGAPRTGAVARNEWAGLLAWAVAQGRAADPATTVAGLRERFSFDGLVAPRSVTEDAGLESRATARPESEPSASTAGQRLAVLGRLLADLRTWQHLPDPVHVVVTLATAATRHGTGEPCWLLMVAPPSSGKTEGARLLDATADARLDDVTAAGLLGWSKGKTVRPSGVLTRVGPRALVTFGDLSSLLATSDRGGREQVFGLLRRAYDGHVSRDVSPPGKVVDGPDQLAWTGRLTVVACVTGAIDRYSAHADQLGPRWINVRIPERSTEEKRAAAQLARRTGLAEHRKRGRELVAGLLADLPPELPELSDEVAEAVEDAALVTAWGRGSVPRNGYGRREIEGVPVVEEPMRLVQQLGAVARGVRALGLSEEAATAITRRVALDSMPASRRAVLRALATGEVLTTAGCARNAGLDRKVARMTLEELAAIGVVENDRDDDESDEQTGVVHWNLAGDDGVLVVEVFQAFVASGEGWDEKWVYTSTSPQEGGADTPSPGVHPTLRPTSADLTGDGRRSAA